MRIVSLCPSITETLIDFGLADSLVGITRYCIHPREVTRGLPKVGGTKNPDLDAIREARPDLVFVNEEENTKEAYEALAREHVVEVSFPKTVGEVPAVLRHFGRLTGAHEIAEQRARELETALAALDAARAPRTRARELAIATESAALSFAYLIWRDPWMTVNRDTYVSDLLARAGGRNIYASEGERYPTISLTDLAERTPDLVLLPDEPFRFREKDRDELRALLPQSRIELVSGDDCCWHGVRSIRGVALAQSLFHC